MNETPFEQFGNHCKENEKNALIYYTAYCLYQKRLHAAIEAHRNKSDESPDVNDIRTTLLAGNGINTFVDRAESIVGQAQQEVSRRFRWKEFLISACASAFGNLIYFILIILLYIFAKDQITSWFKQLLEN